MHCSRCDKELEESEFHTHKGRPICEDCLIRIGLFPLEHTGQHRRLFHTKDSKKYS